MNSTFKFVLAGALCAPFLAPALAQACSCMAPPAPKIALEKSAAVFVGRVASVEKSDGGNTYQFAVSKQWKGVDGNTAAVVSATDSAACGINFDADRDYLVYAFKNEGDTQLRTNLCSRTKRAADAATDLAELGAPVKSAATTQNTSAPNYAVSPNGVVQIAAGAAPNPLAAFAKALDANKTAQSFRLNWSSPMNDSFVGTSLYNRADSTLKAYSRAQTGDEINVSSVLYSGVTDEVLQKLAATDTIEDFFRTYANYGVTKKDVGSKTVSFKGSN